MHILRLCYQLCHSK